MGIQEGVSVVYEGDLPARTGIGSSSSFTVGLLNVLHAYKNTNITKFDLASEAIYVEQQILKENVGVQDQIMASYGGIRLIDVGPNDKWRAAKMYISTNYMKEFESHIMLGFSGVSRYAEEQSKIQVNNIKEGKSEMELRAMVALAADAIDSIGREDEMHVLGNLLNLGWSIKRSLADGISKDWIDKIYQQSLECGSLGGKLMGAGGGGFFMFLVPPKQQEEFKKKMNSIKVWVPFKFDTHGSQIIHESN
jgi:D-glycero-alpha-D-manno-heptose-7-phosphate kinase